MKYSAAFGSAEWIAEVFSSPPERDVGGRSRKTHRAAPKFEGATVWTEGGNETTAMYLLEYLIILGVVKRWKPQPFPWFDDQKVPDCLAEIRVERQPFAVIQVKSEKYLTPAVQAEFDVERQELESVGMRHLVWTEKRPLTPAMRSALFRIRGARNTPHNPEDLVALVRHVQERGRLTLGDIAAAGYEPALVPIALRSGELYVSLKERLDAPAIVSATPIIDARSFLLGSGFDAESWWNHLPRR